jgi:SAM-dependent methyltransferase
MKNGTKIQNWFETWFNSPYYHVLYKNRDYTEARVFLTNLLTEINPKKNASILDLACGKGRHAIFLHKLGYNVTGTDLSKSSIQWAGQFEEPGLKFMVKDMRAPIENVKFNCIFNLFTSFGYFDNSKDNIKVLRAANQMLETNGCLVIDFLNVHYVRNHFVSEETIDRNGLIFHINREFKDDQIQKTIRFTDKDKSYEFTEYVQALDLGNFKDLLAQADMYIYKTFGNYQMETYNPDTSDRLILICKKKI